MERLSMAFTPSQGAEVKRCSLDFVYFCETYLKVNNPKRGLAPLVLQPFQRRYAAHLKDHRLTVAKKFRQGGFTTVTLAYQFWKCLFRLGHRVLWLCRTDREAVCCGDVIRIFCAGLPTWLLPEFERHDDHLKHFAESDSQMRFTSIESTCGQRADHIVIDEPAFIPRMGDHWKALFPCLPADGHVVAVSTPNRPSGWFYETYMGCPEK
jgi:hypothetical protein